MNTDDKILELFKKKKDSYLSGEEVSHSLGISRQALWKHIEKLRDTGYIIDAVPHLGYKLMRVPDKILTPEVTWNLKTKIMGKEIYSHESVGSTNDIAYRMALEGAGEGIVVIAEEQTRGRGRLGRKWASPSGYGVYLSCVLRPDISPLEVSTITLVGGVSAAKAIRVFTGLEALVRWPNDILISDRKAGGILTELQAETDKVNFVILGIGININTPRNLLPGDSTSLREESRNKSAFSRVDFIKLFLRSFEDRYIMFKEKGFSPLMGELKSYSCTLGRDVNIATGGNKKISGKAIDIDENGALVVKLQNGKQKIFFSGDVTFIR